MSIKRQVTDIADQFDKEYLNAENRKELDYWAPLSQMVAECQEARDRWSITQNELANRMGTKQSVISRFENMDGRLPNYDFIARMSQALGYAPAMSLYGDYTVTVPARLHDIVAAMAIAQGMSPRRYVEVKLEHMLVQLEHGIFSDTRTERTVKEPEVSQGQLSKVDFGSETQTIGAGKNALPDPNGKEGSQSLEVEDWELATA